MKKLLKLVLLLAVVAVGMEASEMGMKMPKNYRAVPFAKATILQSGEGKMFCNKCGMTLPMFYRTNHAAMVDGKQKQFCSIYCLVESMNSGAKVSDVKVVDNTTLKFIDVKDAYYVVGSSKPATMAAKISKYAFGTKEAADAFAKSFGGKVMSYTDTLALAKADYTSDTKMKKMRQAKGAMKGEKIYKKMCSPIDQKFKTAGEAKAYIMKHKSCGNLKGKPLQMVGLYLAK